MVSKSFVTAMLYPYLVCPVSKHVKAYQLCQCNTQTWQLMTTCRPSRSWSKPPKAWNWRQRIRACFSGMHCMHCFHRVPWRSPIVPVDLVYSCVSCASCASCYLLRLTAAKHITTSPTHYTRFGRSALITQLLKFALLQVTVRRVMKQILSIKMPLF